MSERAFSSRTLVIAGTLGLLSLLAGLAAIIFGGEVRDVRSAGADGFSSSAIGHRAFVELLRQSGRHVVLDRRDRSGAIGSDALLLLLEPESRRGRRGEDDDRVARALAEHRGVLIALPKWSGDEDPRRPGWLGSAELVSADVPARMLARLGVSATIVRPTSPSEQWQSTELALEPDLPRPQLARSIELEPVLQCESGILLARLPREDGARHYVLSDPDILANHGLGRGANAALALEILALVAGPDVPIVVDELIHGHGIDALVWTELGRFPLVLVLLQTVLALAFLSWASARRFGAPQEERQGLEAGKRLLIESTTGLLMSGGFASSLLRRYLEQNARHVAERYHLPADLAPKERDARLCAIRSEGPGLDEVRRTAASARGSRRGGERSVLHAARVVQRWREELLHGDR